MQVNKNVQIGAKLRATVKRQDGTQEQTEWADNNFLSSGLKYLSGLLPTISHGASYMYIGTGTAPTSSNQVTLENPVGYITAGNIDYAQKKSDGDHMVLQQTYRYSGDMDINANIVEAGFATSHNPSAYNDPATYVQLNRVVFQDSSGNPTPVSVQVGDQLIIEAVLYIRILVNRTGQINLRSEDGTLVSTHDYTARYGKPIEDYYTDTDFRLTLMPITLQNIHFRYTDTGGAHTFTSARKGQFDSTGLGYALLWYGASYTEAVGDISKISLVFGGISYGGDGIPLEYTFTPPMTKGSSDWLEGTVHVSFTNI